MGRGNTNRACLGVGLLFLPFAVGLGYVLVVAAWRLGRFLWTVAGPRLAEGDPATWVALGMVVFLAAVIVLIFRHAGRDGGPSPVPGRAVHQGEDWYWNAEPIDYPPERKRAPGRGADPDI
ncbi:hypothetical protein ACGFYA_26500 [Streptomyces sp. NPDC048305]|uniref:hypothetical protein n=1 Tax=Streptomyces sp. NPDC048305 TaxID=3365532 RepID=UPI0037109AB1